jgi:hypothetical protein
MTTVPSYDAVWTVEVLDPNKRYPMKSQPVPAGEPAILEHSGTCHYLASDIVEYRNDFGIEYEVSVHSFATLNKSQSLALEKAGKLNSDLPTKFQCEQNMWTFVTSNDPSTDFDASKFNLPKPEEVMSQVWQKLIAKGTYGIRGLCLIITTIIKSGRSSIGPEDFFDIMNKYGIVLSLDVNQLSIFTFKIGG